MDFNLNAILHNIVLSPREKSLLLWIVVLFIYFIRDKKVREKTQILFKSFLRFKIQVMIGISLLWTFFSSWILYQINFWEISLLKETLIWGFCSGVLLVFNSVSQKNKSYLSTLKALLAPTAILAFFVNFYSFSLLTELIILPIMSFIIIIDTVAKAREDLKDSRKITSILVGLMSLIYFSVSILNFTTHITFNEVLNESKNIILPFLLYTLSIPILYLWSVIALYEDIFLIFSLPVYKNKKSLVLPAKKMIVRHCLANTLKLKMLSKNVTFRVRLINANNLTEINEAINLAVSSDYDELREDLELSNLKAEKATSSRK